MVLARTEVLITAAKFADGEAEVRHYDRNGKDQICARTEPDGSARISYVDAETDKLQLPRWSTNLP